MDIKKIVAIAFLVILAISIGLNIHYYVSNKEGITTDTTVIIKTKLDTITDTVPVVKYEKKLAVLKDTFKVIDTIHDTITGEDVAVVDVPITQKVYQKDSLYTAYVSGYRQNLDSINVFTKTITIDRNITITKKIKNKWFIGPVIYGGYDIVNRKAGAGVGVAIGYSLFSF